MSTKWEFDFEAMTMLDLSQILVGMSLLQSEDQSIKMQGTAILIEKMIKLAINDLGAAGIDNLPIALDDFVKAFAEQFPPERFR